MTHAAESTHWYSRDGQPVYEVDSADGKKKVTPDIRHARKLGLVPGFTAVNNILAKPGLEKWKREQSILAALTLTRSEGESDKDFLARVDDDSRAHAEQRADEGAQIHKAIEQFLRGEAYDTRWHEHVVETVKVLRGLGQDFVGDFKTKETVAGKQDRDLFFDEHIMQLACYKRGVARQLLTIEHDGREFRTESTFAHPVGYGGRVDVHSGMVGGGARCVSIIIPVDSPKDIRVKLWDQDEENRGLGMFDLALGLWKLKQKYESGWSA